MLGTMQDFTNLQLFKLVLEAKLIGQLDMLWKMVMESERMSFKLSSQEHSMMNLMFLLVLVVLIQRLQQTKDTQLMLKMSEKMDLKF